MDTSNGAAVFPYEWNLRRTFEQILRAAEIPKRDERGRVVTMHSFRHTFSTLLMGKVDPFTHQAAMGHAKITTTAIYTHADTPDIPMPELPGLPNIVTISAYGNIKDGYEKERPTSNEYSRVHPKCLWVQGLCSN
jgi:hypothetical protein